MKILSDFKIHFCSVTNMAVNVISFGLKLFFCLSEGSP